MREKKPDRLPDPIKRINTAVVDRFGGAESISLQLAGAACVGNTLIGIGKLVMGILALSFFTCASAFYTFGMVIAKLCALAGIRKETTAAAQYRYYKLSGLVLLVSSILYIVYSARLLTNPVISAYSIYVALAIATFTFAELAVNIRGVIVYRHSETPLMHALKMINLASSLICLVLTQTALLSISPEANLELQPYANGLLGILVGAAATILGIIMMVRIYRIQKKTGRKSA